ncbi:BirA family biotin operon repressor/biotin-[acetyl-CoA-carboxylase] ligase [Methanohalophilus levihalophilus]|uniref:biotin--[acetyl-CoA-carboxylase] ligase n=1 Tax=Methanohalophilus levihalophilus TaxID=1431282 RepID=UPI001AE5473C|nr:biotin--[acetyl-CoA-carboxylase] ligase [Methanohalophilus levihalophilus]MBP2029140.1 BirA family biotin operon repressor/biotin-[acetyl-CoA-carboxylase] ligase [Methanohalophilus levihalophilus]
MQNNILEVIRILKGANGQPVSGAEIGTSIGVSRTMIWKYVQALQKRGYSIESIPGSGYILRSEPDFLYPELITEGLDTDIIGTELVYYDKVQSTNDIAKQIGSEASDGTVVIAEIQDSGRGRRGCDWCSPEGGIWLSVILKLSMSPSHASRLTLMAGVAVAETLRKIGVNASLKWPNDVLVGGKKICGILTEMEAEAEIINYVVIGIGINANMDPESFPDDLKKTSTTIKYELGKEIDRVIFVQSLLSTLEQHYIKFNTGSFDEILQKWIDLSDTLGKQVCMVTPVKMYEGKAIGISEDGGLIVEMADGSKETLISGRCMYV